MTGNCAALQALADEPGYVQINTNDAEKLGIRHRDLVWVSSRRGKVISRADVSERINSGTVYMTYQWWIGACNELTGITSINLENAGNQILCRKYRAH